MKVKGRNVLLTIMTLCLSLLFLLQFSQRTIPRMLRMIRFRRLRIRVASSWRLRQITRRTNSGRQEW